MNGFMYNKKTSILSFLQTLGTMIAAVVLPIIVYINRAFFPSSFL